MERKWPSIFDQLLLTTVEMNASDLHIVTGEPPVVRVKGEIRRLNQPALSRSEARLLADSILTDRLRAQFAEELSVDSPFLGRQSTISCQHFYAIERCKHCP